MMTLDAARCVLAPKHVFPLSRVSTAAFAYSSRYPVEVSLVSEDGEVISCGFLPPATLDWKKIEFKGFAGLRLEAVVPDPKPREKTVESPQFLVQMDLRHKVGEPVSSERMTESVPSAQRVTEQERTRRHVMATLKTLGVMPTEEQMDALEMELGFDFEADEFGDYLEDDEDLPSPGPSDSPAPDPGPEPEPDEDDVQ